MTRSHAYQVNAMTLKKKNNVLIIKKINMLDDV